MPCSALRSIKILVLIAVACAQVFGVRHAFVCECGEVPKVTFRDHCDGPHGNGCHDENGPFHNKRDHKGGEQSRDHAVYKEGIAGIKDSPGPLPGLQRASLPEVFCQELNSINQLIRPVSKTRRTPLSADGTGSYWAYRLSRMISLRI